MPDQMKARVVAVRAAMAGRGRGDSGKAPPPTRFDDTVVFRPGHTVFFSFPMADGEPDPGR